MDMHFVTPTYRPAGGVVKIFDYLNHARSLGYRCHVYCPEPLDASAPLFDIPSFQHLPEDRDVRYVQGLRPRADSEDWIVFSWPPHWEDIVGVLAERHSHHRAIHLVQNVRHANPSFTRGYSLRLLGRPMTRITVAEQVTAACAPYLNPHSITRTIVEGHNWKFFHRARSEAPTTPVKVAYTTWKSQVGIRVEEALSRDERFRFRSIRQTVSWRELRELYRWADVFLCCPSPEEGFYLPGLEAMAAGCVVVTPDVGGNLAYCRFGENSLLVPFDSVQGYVGALARIADMAPSELGALRTAAYAALKAHTLDRERDLFADVLLEATRRVSRDRKSVLRRNAGHATPAERWSALGPHAGCRTDGGRG